MKAKEPVKPAGKSNPKTQEKTVATEKPVEKQDVKILDTTRGAVPFSTGNIPGPKMARAVMPAIPGKMPRFSGTWPGPRI